MKVLLLDGYNLIYRALAGFNEGEFSLIFNFYRSLKNIITTHKAECVIIGLEGAPEHRQILSEGSYKEGRPQQSDSFHQQKKQILNSLRTIFPCVIARHPKLECDDTLASIAVELSKDHDVTIVSSDTDFIQVLELDLGIKLWNPIKKEYIQKFECDYIKYKSLKGDSTDNIDGLAGIGDVKARKLMSDPKALEKKLSEGNNREIYERNIGLIQFHYKPLSEFELSSVQLSEKGIYNFFKDMQFESIVNDKTWLKWLVFMRKLKTPAQILEVLESK